MVNIGCTFEAEGLSTGTVQARSRMPDVLFVCVHNSGRSQMAEAIFNALAAQRGLRFRAASAGTEAGTRVQLAAKRAMAEIGIDMRGHHPKQLTQAMADRAERIITMGCGVDAASCPARFLVSEDWGLDDPKGRTFEEVRGIREEIRARIEALLEALEREEGRTPAR